MNDRITQIFGLLMTAAAVVLALWEYRAWRGTYGDNFLLTRSRLRRRLLIAGVLAGIGGLLVLEGSGVIPTDDPRLFLAYAASMLLLAIVLLILAGADFIDTVRHASTESLRELERSLQPPPAEDSQTGNHDESR